MKRKITLLIMLSIICTAILGFGFDAANAATTATTSKTVTAPTAATTEAVSTFQRVNYVNAIVTGCEELNVRQGPSTEFKLVNVLKKGQTVKVFGKLGNWYAIYEPEKGCVGVASSAYLKAVGTVAAAAPTPAIKPTVAPAPSSKAVAKPALVAVAPAPVSGISQDEQSLLNLINKARTDTGVAALDFDMDLMKDARLKAKDMADNNYFSHQSPTYGSPFDMMKQFGINFKTAGENIAGNQTVDGAFKAWMSSEGHKKNILNANFNYSGIGIVSSQTYGKILVEQFIGR
jgi:uncharacterized YkwD family protein